MPVTDFRSEVQSWRTGEVIRLSWVCDGKPVRVILRAKGGARYVPPSGLSAFDRALAEGLGAKTNAQAKAILAAPENQALIAEIRKAGK